MSGAARDGLHPDVVAPAAQIGEERVVVAEPLRYTQTQRGEGDAVGVLTVGQPLALVGAIVDATHGEAVQVLAAPAERRLQNAVQLGQGGRARHIELAPDQRADPSDHHPQAVDLLARPGGVWRAGIHLDLLHPSLLDKELYHRETAPTVHPACGVAASYRATILSLSQEPASGKGDAGMANPPMATIVADFLTDLTRAGKSANTVRGYRSDLGDFGRFFTGPIDQITVGVLRAYLGGLAGKAPATRARREAALAALMTWAYRAEMIAADPMTRLDRTHPPVSVPRPVPTEQVEAVLRAIPKNRDRDRVLFLLLYTTGMRVGEALTIEVDDLNLRRDDEHVTVLGKAGRRRTVLLDDSTLVALLRRYLKARGYRHGSLFRAEQGPVSVATPSACDEDRNRILNGVCR